MSAGVPDHPDEADIFLFNILSKELDTHNIDALEATTSQPNIAPAPPVTNPWMFELDYGKEFFLVDNNGTSIGCSSARLHRPSMFDPATAQLDRPDRQTNNIFIIDTILTIPPLQANENATCQVGVKPLIGRGDSIYVGPQNLVPIGNKPGETYLIRQRISDGFDPFQDVLVDYEAEERRYNVLIRQAWVEGWQRMYRVARPRPDVRDVYSENELEALRS